MYLHYNFSEIPTFGNSIPDVAYLWRNLNLGVLDKPMFLLRSARFPSRSEQYYFKAAEKCNVYCCFVAPFAVRRVAYE